MPSSEGHQPFLFWGPDMIIKRIVSALALLAIVAWPGVSVAIVEKTPASRMVFDSGPGRSSGWIVASDTSLTSSYKLVALTGFTQMSVRDTLRMISSSGADSANITLYTLRASDTTVVGKSYRLSGTDTVFATIRSWMFEGAAVDTESAGTIKILSKTGGTITTILPGHLQTYVAQHFTGWNGCGIDGWGVDVDPNGPAVQVQLRFYPDFADAKATPETGFRVLDERIIGGARVIRPQVSKQIVAANNDTSTEIFSTIGLTRIGYFSVTTSSGTSNTATYLDVTSDRTNWKQTNAIDSLSTVAVTTTQVRSRTIAVDSLYGQPWARLIVNGKAAAGDTTTVNTYLTLDQNPSSNREPGLWLFTRPVRVHSAGFVAIYARALGAHARITAAKISLYDK